MRSVGPPLPQTIGLPTGIALLCVSWSACRTPVLVVDFGQTKPLVRYLFNMPVCEKSVYICYDLR